MFISHSGKVVDGDAVLFATALPLHARGRLKEVIATVMSNLGLEVALRAHGIGLVRTQVDGGTLLRVSSSDNIVGSPKSLSATKPAAGVRE